MPKTSKTKNKGKIVNSKNTKLPMILLIGAIVLIITGIGGYLLSNKGLPGGGFNIMSNNVFIDDGGGGKTTCNVKYCTKCSRTNYCSQCKSGYTLSSGKCLKKYRVRMTVTRGSGSKILYVTEGSTASFKVKANKGYVGNFFACSYDSGGYPDYNNVIGSNEQYTMIVKKIHGNVTCQADFQTKECMEKGVPKECQ